MILLLGAALAQHCPMRTPPDTVQLVWISPSRRQVRRGQTIEVVRVDELASFVHTQSADTERVLQVLDMAWHNPGWRARRPHKVVIFEVDTERLCRPLSDAAEGELVEGVAACGSGHCGRSRDRLTGEPGFEVFEISWRDAARSGFCVIPLELYLQEI